jgi:NADH-quinone oxidoreductase subunit G
VYLSPLVALDRERCVLCARCTRFCDQISGDRFIELYDRGAAEQVSIAAGEDFRSPFSGNTIQICPVGALTAVPYRFVARPFDLKSVDTVCMHCSAGCNLRADLRRGKVVRHLARDNPDVNDLWTCDKGRFAFAFSDAPDRLTTPLLRAPGLEPVSFGEAFSAVARWSSGGRVGFLTGGRLMDEDYFALSKLARTAFRTNDLDHRRHPAGDVPEEVEASQAAAMALTYRDIEGAQAILVIGLDAEQEVPILHLRIRKAARAGARIFVIHPRRTRLWDVAEHILCPPGGEDEVLSRVAQAAGGYGGERPSPVEEDAVTRLREALREAGDRGVILAGERLGESAGAVGRAAALASEIGARFALVPRRAGDRGALRAGVHPALLPGGRRVTAAAERAEVEATWGGTIVDQRGRDAAGILQAAASREIDVLYLIGVDPLRDFPDAALARRALANVEFKVVQDISAGPFREYADAILPAAAWHEKDGHVTDWEGRSQRIRTLRPAAGLSRPDWQIFQELSEALESDMGFSSLEVLQEEMASLLRSGSRAEVGPDSSERFPRAADAALSPYVPHRRAAPRAAGTREAGSLVLFTYPLLVDEGRLSEGTPELKEALEERAFLELHPDDAERVGVSEGGRATVRTDGGTATVPVRMTPHIARGAAFVPFNQPGLAANTLLSGRFTTAATVEAAS